ncbi:3-oxoacyl-ACP synthase III family protein [Nocardia sp. BMG51109]|uniref:3-oxoacyl-ACP synthase III family protein n=1 Tax=Nocardia sp. BMG51109 TaxID=1056816 RepID=UPI000464CCC7|nr:3-oxoacyl-[acyl-carrier-protein] synthase III C-terminal domain-containing protein [Nocardia sp. BMG51109]
MPTGIHDFGSYLPGPPVPATFFFTEEELASPIAANPLFKAPTTRHHVTSERAADMIAAAARPMFDRLGTEPAGAVDLLITNVMLPDHPITGSGAETARLLGCTPHWIIDLHNGGCASFGYMLKLADTMIGSGAVRTALLCNVQNGAGQFFSQPHVRKSPYAAVAGDGCGVAYLSATGGAQLMGASVIHAPEYAPDLGLSGTRKYWEPGTEELMVSFPPDKLGDIIERGNRLVPEAVTDVCKQIGVATEDIDVLITNQPNKMFLQNWRQALGVPAERHIDSFDDYGNLYTAGVPVTFERALRAGSVADGDLVVFAGFAHAGDMASAAAVRWSG